MTIKKCKVFLWTLLIISVMGCTSSPPPAVTLKIGIQMG